MIVTEEVETARWDGAADTPMIDAFRGSVTDFAAAHGMDDRHRRDLGVAVEEALTNVVRHAYPFTPAGEVRVEAATDGEFLSVRIADGGVGDDERRDRGTGTSIMRGASERFERGAGLDGQGTVVLMEFAMTAARAQAA